MSRPDREPAPTEPVPHVVHPLKQDSEGRAVQWHVVRAVCGATGVDIGKGLCLFVSAQDNELCVDKINTAASPQEGLPLPSVAEVLGARAAVIGCFVLGSRTPYAPPSGDAAGL